MSSSPNGGVRFPVAYFAEPFQLAFDDVIAGSRDVALEEVRDTGRCGEGSQVFGANFTSARWALEVEVTGGLEDKGVG